MKEGTSKLKLASHVEAAKGRGKRNVFVFYG